MAYYKQEMLKNSVIIIPNISSEEQVCDFLMQTKIILERDNYVYVIDSFANQSLFLVFKSLLQGNKINYFKPIGLLPFSRFSFINNLNKIIYFFCLQIYLSFKHTDASAYYFWMFFPQLIQVIKLKLPKWKIIFDIVDFHYSPLPNEFKILNEQKKYLLNKADYIFSISNSLKEIYQKYAKVEIKIVPQGFAVDSFAQANEKTRLDLPKGKPIIGFIGQMSERLDFNLLHNLIKDNPQWNFVFVGPTHHESNVSVCLDKSKIDELFAYKNSFHFDKQNRQTMLDVVKHFDVCMIPYDVSYLFNLYCYPMKIFEYFYAGKPVISTPIKELMRFDGLVMLADTSESFAASIKDVLMESWSKKNKEQQMYLAKENSWKMKIKKINHYLTRNLNENKEN